MDVYMFGLLSKGSLLSLAGIDFGSQTIKAVTLNAAYQYGEEDKKGSITPGKQADLIILDHNPMTVDPMTLKDIKVVETIKDGRTIFKAP